MTVAAHIRKKCDSIGPVTMAVGIST